MEVRLVRQFSRAQRRDISRVVHIVIGLRASVGRVRERKRQIEHKWFLVGRALSQEVDAGLYPTHVAGLVNIAVKGFVKETEATWLPGLKHVSAGVSMAKTIKAIDHTVEVLLAVQIVLAVPFNVVAALFQIAKQTGLVRAQQVPQRAMS